MGHLLALVALCILMNPLQAFAGVFVSEVAWMGTDMSATNEWIELANDSALPVDLTGWTLKAKDGSPSIVLSGTIAPEAYFLIERTDDETVLDVAADLVTAFGKGLSNEGETLDLRDVNGTIIDTVKGGKDWKTIGGDAKTKLTPQKRGSVWITAKATPRLSPPLPPPPVPVVLVSEKPAPIVVTHLPVAKEAPPIEKNKPTQELLVDAPVLQKVYGEDATPSGQSQRTSATLPLLGTLLVFGSSAVVYLRQRTKTEVEKYEIIEDETDT